MIQNLAGKKLLIVGGAYQHCKIVEAAKKAGIITYVTDYLDIEHAPAKAMADHWYKHNIYDIDAIVDMCRSEGIDGVISLYLDACQRPYQQIAERLGLPCFASKEQYYTFTDKNAFKRCCLENGVDIIPTYDRSNLRHIPLPVLIKPNDSRGSRGQTVCRAYEDIVPAIELAASASSDSGVVIEKYMGSKSDIQVAYIVISGEPILLYVADRYLGEKEMQNSAIAAVSPSRFKDYYIAHTDTRVKRMLKSMGLINAPVMMQGFMDDDTVRFYDAGLRFLGDERDVAVEKAYGVNIIEPLIEYALTGKSPQKYAVRIKTLHDDKCIAIILIPVRPGRIAAVSGMDEIKTMPEVTAMYCRYSVGDIVRAHYDVNQRFCEIAVLCDNRQHLARTVRSIYDQLHVTDDKGRDMIFERFSPERIL